MPRYNTRSRLVRRAASPDKQRGRGDWPESSASRLAERTEADGHGFHRLFVERDDLQREHFAFDDHAAHRRHDETRGAVVSAVGTEFLREFAAQRRSEGAVVAFEQPHLPAIEHLVREDVPDRAPGVGGFQTQRHHLTPRVLEFDSGWQHGFLGELLLRRRVRFLLSSDITRSNAPRAQDTRPIARRYSNDFTTGRNAPGCQHHEIRGPNAASFVHEGVRLLRAAPGARFTRCLPDSLARARQMAVNAGKQSGDLGGGFGPNWCRVQSR